MEIVGRIMSSCDGCGRFESVDLWRFDSGTRLQLCDVCVSSVKTKVCVGTVSPNVRGGGKVGRRHPDTSRKAAGNVKAGTQQAALLAIVARDDEGVTSFAAAPRLSRLVGHPVSANQTATRMLELRERGLVTEARYANGIEKVRTTTPGNEGKVWVMTVAGCVEARRLGAATS